MKTEDIIYIKYNLYEYCLFMNYDFFISRGKEMQHICDSLQNAYENGTNLMIATPPRFGKSTVSNYFSSWVLLLNKHNSIIRASYSQKLSTELNEGVRQIIDEYKFNYLNQINRQDFTTTVNTQFKLRFKNTKRASLYASSVGGSTTGYGGNILIADDLYKDHLEALSETVNEKTKMWFNSAFLSRLDGSKQTVIVIGTRWTHNEVVAELIKNDFFSEIIEIKALVNGKSFNENVISTEKLLERKKLYHRSMFESMYQQQPMVSLEPLIRIDELNFINKNQLYGLNADFRIVVMDIANTGKDRTTMCCLDVFGSEIVVIDLLTDVRPIEEIEVRINQFIDYYKPSLFLCESNNNDIFVNNFIKKHISAGIDGKSFRSKMNKETKIIRYSGFVKSFYFIDTEDDEYNEFIERMCKYDTSIKHQHDDEIDVMVMAVIQMLQIKGKYGLNVFNSIEEALNG